MSVAVALDKGPYRVGVRNLPEWKTYDTVRMEISVGQPYHEGKKLAAAVDWACSNFKTVNVLVGDLPQRYTIQFENKCSKADAWQIAMTAGDEWLERNRDSLSKPQLKISRWNDWLQCAEYPGMIKQVRNLYDQNIKFAAELDKAARDFFTRRHYSEDQWPEFSKIAHDYLIEESAVFALAFKEMKGFGAYPGSFFKTWQMFVDQDIPGAPEGFKFAKFARIRFDH